MKKMKLIAVVGPTASGKTALSIRLAKEFDAEIISCDSMQIYRGMDIGTAKPTEEEKQNIVHHLIDCVSPDEQFSCADYKALAENAIAGISQRGKLPIFCGGTGLYLDSVIKVSSFSPSVSEEIRTELSGMSPDELYRELKSTDPESAALIHQNNVKRVIRALEIYRGTGRTKTEWDRMSKSAESPYDVLTVRLDFLNREALYERIGLRVDEMMNAGLLDEVRRLDLSRESTAAQAIGYKELYLYLDGFISLNDAVDMIKRNTRNYAKRQLTWFRRDENALVLHPDSPDFDDNYKKIVNIISDHLKR